MSHLPDFLIIGAMKSGTSTLQAQLAAQPGIFMTTPKEPNFFSDDPIYAQGMAWYHSLFEAAEPGDLKGEASTHYTKLPTYPETLARMGAVIEAPRLVYVIRDPFERAMSQYLHEWSQGLVGRDVAQAFSDHPEFIAYSRYPMQLAPFIARYGRDSLLLTSLEALKADPQGELNRIANHIGASGPLVWDSEQKAQNVSAERIRPLPFHGLLVQNPVANALRRTLVPKSVRNWIKATRQRDDRPDLPDGLRAELTTPFQEDRDALAALFPEFAALDLSYRFCAADAPRAVAGLAGLSDA